jgi:hypothetical protein
MMYYFPLQNGVKEENGVICHMAGPLFLQFTYNGQQECDLLNQLSIVII